MRCVWMGSRPKQTGWAIVAFAAGGFVLSAAAGAQQAQPGAIPSFCAALSGPDRDACIANAHAQSSSTKPLPGTDADPPDAAAPAQSTSGAIPAEKPIALPGADADPPGSVPGAHGAAGSSGSPAPSMPGTDADPPSDSMKPLPGYHAPPIPPNGLPSSGPGSSSSSSSGQPVPEDDDDAPPTTTAGDTPVKATHLKDLGSHGDLGDARAKLEARRVPEDLQVGRFYLQTNNLQGAYMRFKDAVEHDPENPDARFGLAQAAEKLKKREEAVQNYQLCLTLDPGGDHDKAARNALKELGGAVAAPAK